MNYIKYRIREVIKNILVWGTVILVIGAALFGAVVSYLDYRLLRIDQNAIMIGAQGSVNTWNFIVQSQQNTSKGVQ